MRLFFACLLLLTAPLSSTDALMGFAVTQRPFTSLTYGIQAFLWWDHGFAGRDMDWVQRMVFSHVKQTFAWEDIEPVPGEMNFSRADQLVSELEAKNLRVVARLSDAPAWTHPNLAKTENVVDAPPDDVALFGRFCGTLAERYRGRIDAYQIWNEPNLSREWGGQTPNAAGYVGLLKACSDAIRAVDPDAILISAGLAPTGNYDALAHPDDLYLQAMYDAGFQQFVDVVGMHAPGFSAPETDPSQGAGGLRFFTFRRVEDLRRIMVANGDAARQVAILEVGWTTDQQNPDYQWFAVDEATQARNLVNAYQYAADHWQPWVGLMSAIYIAAPDWTEADEEWWWAITTPSGYTRPAYIELANMAKYCGTRFLPPRDPSSPEALGLVPIYPCD